MKATAVVVLLLLVAALGGCLFSPPRPAPPLTVTFSPSSGTVPFTVMITVNDWGIGATYTFETSSGERIVSDTPRAQFLVTASSWSVTVTARTADGRTRTGAFSPTIRPNLPPRAYNLDLMPGQNIDWGEKVRLQLDYHEHAGCHPEDTVRFGFKDPEGAALRYKVEIRGPSGVEDVYQNIGGESVRMTGVWSSHPVFYWFNGWSGDKPPIPVTVMCPPTPSPSPNPPPSSMAEKVIRITVDDGYNQPTFEYRVQAASHSPCGSS